MGLPIDTGRTTPGRLEMKSNDVIPFNKNIIPYFEYYSRWKIEKWVKREDLFKNLNICLIYSVFYFLLLEIGSQLVFDPDDGSTNTCAHSESFVTLARLTGERGRAGTLFFLSIAFFSNTVSVSERSVIRSKCTMVVDDKLLSHS